MPSAFQSNQPVDISSMHTRQLLALIDQSRSKARCGCPTHCGDSALDDDQLAFNARQEDFYARLKAELFTREHVPSSAESKLARQAKQRRREKKNLRY